MNPNLLYLFLFFAFSLVGCRSALESIPLKACQKTSGYVGPEDIANYSEQGKARMLVSSHNRRDFPSTGTIYEIELGLDGTLVNSKEALVTKPSNFRPHGISIAKRKGIWALYVISHTLTEPKLHTIEVFERNKLGTWDFKETLWDASLTSPNDLFALDSGEIFVSNDRGTGGSFRANWDILTKNPRADIAYFNGKEFFPLNEPVVLGNGIFVRKEGEDELIYRSVFWDESIYVYKVKRTESGFPNIQLLKKIVVSGGPDNISEDNKGNLWVVVHPSAFSFTRHSLSRDNFAPTKVMRFANHNSGVDTVYQNSGEEISAGSTAVLVNGRLWISQVFEDFLLSCPYPL